MDVSARDVKLESRTPGWPEAVVIIPNWNGAHLLPTVLDSLRTQTHESFQVVVVDNGSRDESLELLARYPEVRVIALSQNLGFSGGCNTGIRQTSSRYVALLNSDTEASPEWLARLCSALEANPDCGSAASKMLLFGRRDVLNAAGDFYGVDGVPGNRGAWQRDNGHYSRPDHVFGGSGGAVLYRRSMLEEIGLFDEDFFMYCEDVDLAWRAQLAGYHCIYIPEAVVYHRLSATGGGPLASYYCGRNFLNVIVKNYPATLLRRFWPRVLKAQLGFACQSLRHAREPAARARLRGQGAWLRQLPLMLRKRRQVQRRRRVSDEHLLSILAP